MSLKFAIITCSDTRSLETDEAGHALVQLIEKEGWECIRHVVETDERPFIAGALIDACDNTDADIVLTCGGSGLSPRDVTPEATIDVSDRQVAGIAEAMRAHSLAITPYAMLSRATCALRGRTLIINLPGSTKAATENWEAIVGVLPHAVKMMAGGGH
jgi:molybdenum cofactor synthesis domain-containing protein